MFAKEKKWSACSCGVHLLQGDDLIDTVYPCNRERTVFNAYCNVSMGGCGRTVYALDIENLNKRWNLGAIDENIEDVHNVFCCGKDIENVLIADQETNKNRVKTDIELALPIKIFLSNGKKICTHREKGSLYSSVKINPECDYANSSFQQEGFGHLKVNDIGTIIKLYDDGTFLVEFIDEGVEKSNIYSKEQIIFL